LKHRTPKDASRRNLAASPLWSAAVYRSFPLQSNVLPTKAVLKHRTPKDASRRNLAASPLWSAAIHRSFPLR